VNISTFYGLNVGVSALETAQQVEDVISNNIANANTPGYAQETPTLEEYTPFPTVPAHDAPILNGQMGQGSQVSSVHRDTSAFLDMQDRVNQGTYQMYSTHQQNLTQIEGILNEPSSQSMQNAMDQFFASWQTLSTDPSNTAARQSVIAQAQQMGQTFQTITNELETLQSNLTNVVTGQIGQLNTDANQVYQLNTQIVRVLQQGQQPNQLMDQRSQILDQMAQMANISYTQQSNGADYITLAGSTLVDGSNSYLAGTTTPYTSPPAASYTAQTAYTFASTLKSGSIAGNVQSVNDANTMLNNLDTFLNTFENAVNAIQTSGSTATSSAASPPPPIFSVPSSDTFASTDPVNGSNHLILTVNPSLTTSEIATGGATWGGPGDNSNALNMVALQNQQQSSLQGATFDQNIASLVSGIGVETASVNTSVTTAQALSQQSCTLRQAVSSVDVNEQAAMMVQYQNSYSAAAKFVSVFDQMMQTLMTIVP